MGVSTNFFSAKAFLFFCIAMAGLAIAKDKVNTIAFSANPTETPSPIPPPLEGPAPCSVAKSYFIIKDFPSGYWTYFNATVSHGYDCCMLCHESYTDCVLAKYDHTKGHCQLKINVAPLTALGHTDMCPMGLLGQNGKVKEEERWDNWEQLIIGPCYVPTPDVTDMGFIV